jgi:hypothetical protein
MRMLFIGNSYTHFNDMPGIFRELSASAGHEVEVQSRTDGGKSLEWHWYNRGAVPLIDEGGRDFVSLQDQSFQTLALREKFDDYMNRFCARVAAAGAKPVLYMTWARRHLPGDQETITEAYLGAAKRNGALLAPVGVAWGRLRAANPELVLHTEDGSHPNFAGSYLAACCFYAAVFGASPEGLTAGVAHSPGVRTVLDADLAAELQRAAWTAAQELG